MNLLQNSDQLAKNGYGEDFEYDFNGNIRTLLRKDATGNTFDEFSYNYNFVGAHRVNNKLNHVDDLASSSLFTTDIEDQTANNYTYDQIGNLTADDTEEIAYINWTVDNKIKNIYRIEGSEKPDLEFVYDASGVRICKIVKPKNPGGTPK